MKKQMIRISFYWMVFAIFTQLVACSEGGHLPQGEASLSVTKQLPKALFITTGLNMNDEIIDLPKGVLIAIQSFNKEGIPVQLKPRDILFDLDFLLEYNFIILPTAWGYHDADRKYSLTYMTEAELLTLKKYVESGGVIITDTNLGRNDFEGNDRILNGGQLNKNNFALAEVFGAVLKEKKLEGYRLDINLAKQHKNILEGEEDNWLLLTDSIISNKMQYLGYWQGVEDSIPAMWSNEFGEGQAYLLPTANFISPVVMGGYLGVEQIEQFYAYVISQYQERYIGSVALNPWPHAKDYAFCASFNGVGELKEYEFLLSSLKQEQVDPVFFVSGNVDDDVHEFLVDAKVELASNGSRYMSYKGISFPLAVNDVLHNQHQWEYDFEGFRFPFTRLDYTGLKVIDRQKYQYESSISVNNMQFLQGSVFPYNLVMSYNGFYKSVDILEVAPTYHDDYFFLSKLEDDSYKTPMQLNKDVQLFSSYLQNFWKDVVKPYNGLMVYVGHPKYTGHNDVTLSPLLSILDTVRSDNAWVTNLSSVVAYHNAIKKITLSIDNQKDRCIVQVHAPTDIKIEGLTINFAQAPKSAKSDKGDTKIITRQGKHGVVFDAFDGQVLVVRK